MRDRSPHRVNRFRAHQVRLGGVPLPLWLVIGALVGKELPPPTLHVVKRQVLRHTQQPVARLRCVREACAVLVKTDEALVAHLFGGIGIGNDTDHHLVHGGKRVGVNFVKKGPFISAHYRQHTKAPKGYRSTAFANGNSQKRRFFTRLIEELGAIRYSETMVTLPRQLEKFKLTVPLSFDVPLAPHTTFRVGGPADILASPRTVVELQQLSTTLHTLGIEPVIIGGGANILVSDRGVRGVVITTQNLSSVEIEATRVYAKAGTAISDVARQACEAGLAGLEFIYAMPGSVGGAVWMNARCYGSEISEVLSEVDCLQLTGERSTYTARADDFAYKVSPFQDGKRVITGATFHLRRGDHHHLATRMAEIERDRTRKGHFRHPSGGSTFKNNRAFGKPTGQIIDELGLRGTRMGGAAVSEEHGNIIVNDQGATAGEIRTLIEWVQREVERRTTLRLEPEVLFLGAW